MFNKNSILLIKDINKILRLCHNVPGLRLIRSLEKVVDPFTKINIETPMHLKIIPIDLGTFPDGNKLIMSLFSNSDEPLSDFNVKLASKTVDVIGNQNNASPNTVCLIQAPIRSSFDIKATGQSNISLERMHSDSCNIVTNTGCITLNNIKGNELHLRSDGGPIVGVGTLQANSIDIRTGQMAGVVMEHLRANFLNVNTHGGQISVESCYSDESHFTSVMGSLVLSNVHKNCIVEILERGDLRMTGFDGTIKAILKRGNVHFQASRLSDKSNIFVHDVGTVDVKIPETFTNMCLIEVIARQLNLEKELMEQGVVKEDTLHKKFRYGEDKMQENINDLLIDARNCTVNLSVSSWKQMMEDKLSSEKGQQN